MESNEKVHVSVPSDYNGKPIEVVLREGSAPKVNEPIRWGVFAVALSSMFNFVETTEFDVDSKKNPGILSYNLQQGSLGMKFQPYPGDDLAPVFTAKLEINPDLVAFGINKDNFMSGKEMIKFARKYAHCFADIEQPTKLIKSLQNFDIKFEQTHKAQDDRKGNSEESVKNALKFTKGEVPLIWNLKLPLFKGTPEVAFDVEIEIEVNGSQPVFAFYSMEMETLLRERGEMLILKEVEKFDGKFTTIEVI